MILGQNMFILWNLHILNKMIYVLCNLEKKLEEF